MNSRQMVTRGRCSLSGWIALLLTVAGLLVSAPMLHAADFSGRYSGRMGPPDAKGAQSVFLLLVQRGQSLSGSLGPNERQQNSFENGTVNGEVASFKVGSLQVRLRFVGDSLEGEIERAGTPNRLIIAVDRVGDVQLSDRFLPLPNEPNEIERSERIIALRDAVERDRAAESAFWKTLETEGTPFFEDILGNDRSKLATFVFRGTALTSSVLLILNPFSRVYPEEYLFSHIPGTDIWFKTLKLPRDARLAYQISENDPLATRPAGAGSRHPQLDVFNPRHFPDDTAAPREAWRSLLEMPDAPKQPWRIPRESVPHLAMVETRLHSDLLNQERTIRVYTPPDYSTTNKAYSTLYFTDGEDADGRVFDTTTIENLLYSQRIRPVVIVRIVNPPNSRSQQLSCAPEFLEFLNSELAPFIRARFHVSSDPLETAIGGFSLGGLMAACAGLKHSETFGLVLAQSGSFWWEPSGKDYAERNFVAREFARTAKLPLKFFIEAGLFEIDLRGTGGNILETSRDLRNVLVAKGYEVRYQEFAGDHEEFNWRGKLIRRSDVFVPRELISCLIKNSDEVWSGMKSSSSD